VRRRGPGHPATGGVAGARGPEGDAPRGILGGVGVHLILDCDGVLVDSEPLSNQALAETLTELGLPFTAERSTAEFMGRSWTSVLSRLGELFGAEVPADLSERYRARMFAAFAAGLEPVPGVIEALAAIDVPACVASSGDLEKIRFTLGRCGLLERFEGRIFSATEVARGKPAPDLFLHAADAMGWEPTACTVVEDSPTGVVAGRAAGMRVLGYAGRTDAGALSGAGASAVFSDMAALPGLLEPS
jgi:HAD superfamily hydrolase (TIGR01509 family)